MGIRSRRYAPQRTFSFEDQSASYARSDVPFIVWRFGELTRLFLLLETFEKQEKKAKRCSSFQGALVVSTRVRFGWC